MEIEHGTFDDTGEFVSITEDAQTVYLRPELWPLLRAKIDHYFGAHPLLSLPASPRPGERGSLEWAGNDPKLMAYRAAILIRNANEDLGPLGPMSEFRMAEVIYHEVVSRILSGNADDLPSRDNA